MPDIDLGTTLVIFIPGLLVYCALYGIFSRGRETSQEPPDPKSVQALTIILIGTAAVHTVTALLIAAGIGIAIPGGAGGLYRTLSRVTAANAPAATRAELAYLLGSTMAQALTGYVLVRLALDRLAARNALPQWLYGWTAQLINQYSESSRIVLAYVLTNIDLKRGTIFYIGVLKDMRVTNERTIQRIGLSECERYCVDLAAPLDLGSAQPLAMIDYLNLESTHICNISFRIVELPAADVADPLAAGLTRLYAPLQPPGPPPISRP